MSILMAVALLGVAAPATEQRVEVGRADWKAMPRLETRERIQMEALVGRVQDLIEAGTCTFKGSTARKFDITVPYAVLLDPQGSTSRVLVSETGCAPLETLVGEVALLRARNGHFRPTGGKPRWHASEINFTLE